MLKKLGLPIAVVLILVFLFFLSARGRKAPFLPADAAHRNAATNASCLACHGPQGKEPLRPKHPPKEQCLYCHKARTQ